MVSNLKHSPLFFSLMKKNSAVLVIAGATLALFLVTLVAGMVIYANDFAKKAIASQKAFAENPGNLSLIQGEVFSIKTRRNHYLEITFKNKEVLYFRNNRIPVGGKKCLEGYVDQTITLVVFKNDPGTLWAIQDKNGHTLATQ